MTQQDCTVAKLANIALYMYRLVKPVQNTSLVFKPLYHGPVSRQHLQGLKWLTQRIAFSVPASQTLFALRNLSNSSYTLPGFQSFLSCRYIQLNSTKTPVSRCLATKPRVLARIQRVRSRLRWRIRRSSGQSWRRSENQKNRSEFSAT